MGAFSGERVLHFGCCPILTGNNNNHWHPSPSAAASCRLQRAFLKYQLSSAHDKIKHFLFRKKKSGLHFLHTAGGRNRCDRSWLLHTCTPASRSICWGQDNTTQQRSPSTFQRHGLSPIHTFFRVVLVCLPPVRLPPIHCLS